jgi:ParB family chromosome partitioning protein
MARRDIFRNIKDPESQKTERPAPTGYTARGASRNMLASIGELAEKAAKADLVLEGEAIVEIDPGLIDRSFIPDRMEEDGEAFREVLEAIQQHGQESPALLRPHPTEQGRYQTVFGHRRVRAASELGRKVRAIIRQVSDKQHVIAQGQENSARENLSFIERAIFAQRLLDQKYDRQTIQEALTVDAPMLTRMLSVSGRVPENVATAIGPSKGIGRDRWLEFAQLVEAPEGQKLVTALIATPDFSGLASDARFECLLSALKANSRQRRTSTSKPVKDKWEAPDKAIAAEFTDTGRVLSLAFKAKGGVQFGRFIVESLERLYDEYKQRSEEGEG